MTSLPLAWHTFEVTAQVSWRRAELAHCVDDCAYRDVEALPTGIHAFCDAVIIAKSLSVLP